MRFPGSASCGSEGVVWKTLYPGGSVVSRGGSGFSLMSAGSYTGGADRAETRDVDVPGRARVEEPSGSTLGRLATAVDLAPRWSDATMSHRKSP